MSAPDPREAIIDHLPAMRAFAISLTRNATLADDVVQDAVVKAWSRFDQFEAGTNLRAWLFTILRNALYSYHRKHRREVSDSDGTFAGRLAVKPDHNGRLMLRDVMAAFETLPVEQREVLLLIGAAGFSYEEAAGMCGVSLGTVKSRMARGRQALYALLGADWCEGGLDEVETLAVLSNQGNAGRLSA